MDKKRTKGLITRRECIHAGMVAAIAGVNMNSLTRAESMKPAIVRTNNDIIVRCGEYETIFSASNGSILSIGKRGSVSNLIHNDSSGLWTAKFQDGTIIQSSDFEKGKEEALFAVTIQAKENTVLFDYTSPQIKVKVSVHPRGNELVLNAEIQSTTKNVIDFSLPARLRFDPANLKEMVFPINGNMGVGGAFESSFFQKQSSDHPAGWQQVNSGPNGYELVFGSSPAMRPNDDPPVPLTVTSEGEKWLDPTVISELTGSKAVVNRPPSTHDSFQSLVDSPNGSWFSRNHLGGVGSIWRIGGAVGDAEKSLVLDSVGDVLKRLSTGTPTRIKIGVISLEGGPDSGGWAAVTVNQWIQLLYGLPTAASNDIKVIRFRTPEELASALDGSDYIAILNPYGEGCPTLPNKDIMATVEAIRKYVRKGGNWFETGGYPFFYAMEPLTYFQYSGTYPSLFADFIHIDFIGASISLFRIQSENTVPWIGARQKSDIFIPGNLGCGGDEKGGYIDRTYGVYLKPNEMGFVPSVCIRFGDSSDKSLVRYCESNNIRRLLKDKVKHETLDKLKRTILVYYAGNAKEKMLYLSLLPKPTLIHFADYIHGGFDKQYPDLLPPNPDFGTPEELKAFYDQAHHLGHLVMPYTNTTWWCDHPKGPTFLKDGNAPLVKQFNGEPIYEKYNANDGWTDCPWHPDVRAANLRIRRQFTVDYPSDVLFQDQVGARGWVYDMNPASPTPYAYTEGLLSQSLQDSQFVPLSTEAGWDRVSEFETQLCGLSWELVPTTGGPPWRKLMKTQYPVTTWRVYPLAQRIAHQRSMMLFHDLGQFVMNHQTLVWALALGFSLSFTTSASGLQDRAKLEWLRWLDRLQKSVCARYIGAAVVGFDHDWGTTTKVEDDGVIIAKYGGIRILANLGPDPRIINDHDIAPYGFLAESDDVSAGSISSINGDSNGFNRQSFVLEWTEKMLSVWVYAPEEQKMRLPINRLHSGKYEFHFDSGEKAIAMVRNETLEFMLPSKKGTTERITPPQKIRSTPPIKWGDKPPSIGVLEIPWMGELAWTKQEPQDWVYSLSKNSSFSTLGIRVTTINSIEKLDDALKSGAKKFLTIINPYGEKFPVDDLSHWKDTLTLIRDYVRNGGNWWETGGQSFTQPIAPNGQSKSLGGDGLAFLGIGIDSDDNATDVLTVTPMGREWLGDKLSNHIQGELCNANRSLPKGYARDHQTLVCCGEKDFIGGYRLGGWGWLWRIGGFYPNTALSRDVVIGATLHEYTSVIAPVMPEGVPYLWHAEIHSENAE